MIGELLTLEILILENYSDTVGRLGNLGLEQLVERGILEEADILRRKEGEGRDFFAHHEAGRIMEEEIENIRSIINQVRSEPEPDPASIFDHIYAPFPEVEETATEGKTNITYAGAIRSALDTS